MSENVLAIRQREATVNSYKKSDTFGQNENKRVYVTHIADVLTKIKHEISKSLLIKIQFFFYQLHYAATVIKRFLRVWNAVNKGL